MSHGRRCPHSHLQLIQKLLPKVSEHHTSGCTHTCWHSHTYRTFSTDAFSEHRHLQILADT